MANVKTTQIASALSLTTSYQNVDQPESFGHVGLKGGQVVLSFKRTGGTSVTFKIQELFSFMQEDDTEMIGYTTRSQVDGDNLENIELTSTETEFQYAFISLADKIRVQVKGAGSESLDLVMSAGKM